MLPTSKEAKELVTNNIKLYGKSLYLFGTAMYGKVFKPTKITSLSHLYSEYGEYGSIIDNYISIKGMVNNINVYCVKITGHESKCSININIPGEGAKSNGLCFISNSNEKYNDIKLSIFNDSLVFEFPEELNKPIYEYKINQYEPLYNLIDRINEDDNEIYCFCTCDNTVKPYGNMFNVNPNIVYFCGGESGLNASKLTLYNGLKQAYDLLEEELIDVLVPLECYIDDECNFYSLTMDFALKQLSNGICTIPVLGFNPNNNNLDYYINQIVLPKIKELNIEQYEPYSSLVQIFVGDIITSYNIDKPSNGYVVYAALLCTVNINTPPTVYHIEKNIFLYDEFDNNQIKKISEYGLMCFRDSPLYQCIVCANNRTPSNDGHYKFIHNVRSIEISSSCLYDILDKCLGCNMSELFKNNSLLKILKLSLDILMENNILEDYNIDIKVISDNSAEVYLKLKTQYMTDFIEKKGSLK